MTCATNATGSTSRLGNARRHTSRSTASSGVIRRPRMCSRCSEKAPWPLILRGGHGEAHHEKSPALVVVLLIWDRARLGFEVDAETPVVAHPPLLADRELRRDAGLAGLH